MAMSCKGLLLCNLFIFVIWFLFSFIFNVMKSSKHLIIQKCCFIHVDLFAAHAHGDLRAKFIYKPNQTHLNHLIKIFKNT